MSHGTSLVTKGRIFRAVENATRGLIFAGLVVPVLTSVSPSSGMQGQTVRMTLVGSNLSAVTTISFGAGITVGAIESKTNTEIIVSILIDPVASLGFRDVSVSSPTAVSTLTNAFEVVARYADKSTGGGGAGKPTLRLVTVIKKRKYFDDAIGIKVVKAGSDRYQLAIGVSKRLETTDSVVLGVSQTQSMASMLVLSVDKQGDIADVQVLEGRVLEAALLSKALFTSPVQLVDYEVEEQMPSEVHIENIEQGYNGTEQKLYSEEE